MQECVLACKHYSFLVSIVWYCFTVLRLISYFQQRGFALPTIQALLLWWVSFICFGLSVSQKLLVFPNDIWKGLSSTTTESLESSFPLENNCLLPATNMQIITRAVRPRVLKWVCLFFRIIFWGGRLPVLCWLVGMPPICHQCHLAKKRQSCCLRNTVLVILQAVQICLSWVSVSLSEHQITTTETRKSANSIFTQWSTPLRQHLKLTNKLTLQTQTQTQTLTLKKTKGLRLGLVFWFYLSGVLHWANI